MPVYIEFEVSLREIKPRIWRRFLLRADATFEDLHNAIQDAMGWTHSHLWEFRKGGRRGEVIAAPRNENVYWDEDDESDGATDAAAIEVAAFFKARGAKKCVYEYDFGDGWEHDVVAKKHSILPDEFLRRLLAGARACPPEDCGSTPGYATCCAFVATGKHPWMEPEEFADWLGDWTPERLDLDAAREAFDMDRE